MSLPKCMDFTDYNRYPGEENPTTDAQMQDFMLNQNLLVKAAAARMWQPSTEYATGDIVTSPSMPAGTEAVCTGAGISDAALEPEWRMNTSIPDGSCFWQLRYVHYMESLATDDEAIAGEDGEKIITPSAMRAAIDAILAGLNVGVKTINAVAPDSGGNINIKDYVSNLAISGKTLTVTFKDGTTKTLNTQDTTYSVATTSEAGLMSATDKTKLDTLTENGKMVLKQTITGSAHSVNPSVTKTISGLIAEKPALIKLSGSGLISTQTGCFQIVGNSKLSYIFPTSTSITQTVALDSGTFTLKVYQ